MGHKHSRETLLDAALGVVATEGLHRLSFGRVASRVGTSDRVVVYYFPTKDALVEAVLAAVGDSLRAGLAGALDQTSATDHLDLVRRAWAVVRTPEAQAPIAAYVEAIGLAAAGVAPYTSMVGEVVASWTGWFEQHLEGSAARRRSQAMAALTVLDGLLLVRVAGGPDLADEAARALGVA